MRGGSISRVHCDRNNWVCPEHKEGAIRQRRTLAKVVVKESPLSGKLFVLTDTPRHQKKEYDPPCEVVEMLGGVGHVSWWLAEEVETFDSTKSALATTIEMICPIEDPNEEYVW